MQRTVLDMAKIPALLHRGAGEAETDNQLAPCFCAGRDCAAVLARRLQRDRAFRLLGTRDHSTCRSDGTFH